MHDQMAMRSASSRGRGRQSQWGVAGGGVLENISTALLAPVFCSVSLILASRPLILGHPKAGGGKATYPRTKGHSFGRKN